MPDPVISTCSYILVHVPGFVRHGSKPSREIVENEVYALPAIEKHLRNFEDAVAYPPNQVFIGNLHPDRLNDIEQPWHCHPVTDPSRYGVYGEIMPEEEFLGLMKLADDFDLMWIDKEGTQLLRKSLQTHPFWRHSDLGKIDGGVDMARIYERIQNSGSLPLYYQGRIVGCMHRHHDQDDTLKAHVLMENLMAKASGALALMHLLKKAELPAGEIDIILNCSEEAVGDRYNRGGGGLAKAIGEMCGCVSATGCDIKAFCVAPLYALLQAFCLVKSGLFKKVAVVGGGSMAKLGMKFLGHIAKDMSILEDVLGGIAFLVTEDDGESPIIRLDGIGKHHIGSRMIGTLAVLRREISREEIGRFVLEHGMPGFAPTQGHIPAAVPFLGHAIDGIKRGKMNNAMFVARGSLFLGRMTQLSDGLSFLLERNPGKQITAPTERKG